MNETLGMRYDYGLFLCERKNLFKLRTNSGDIFLFFFLLVSARLDYDLFLACDVVRFSYIFFFRFLHDSCETKDGVVCCVLLCFF